MRPRSASTWQHFSVKMPGGVPERWQDNGETEQQRDHPDRQACRYDQSPHRHRARISQHDAD